ncbi:complex I subunit 4 family protein [Buchnera aphidicola]|uniref:complex I subunit 4 family protein n=1 Tax=Buchnera aphidicola TaxID=9 RepID=UPI00094D0A5F|nr:NADH-quinone oxidoreductase subunit M [Buchnera aphidicola]
MLLLILILIPFLGSFLSFLSIRLCLALPRIIAMFSIFFCFFISVYLFFYSFFGCKYNNIIANHWISEFSVPWVPNFGIFFHLGLDKLSLLMILLTSFIGIIAILCEWYHDYKNIEVFYFLFQLIIAATLGVFLSLDLFLFFCFFELLLLSIYYIIVIWGYKYIAIQYTRLHAARKFFIYSQLSGLFFLLSSMLLAWVHYNSSGIWTFNYCSLLNTPMSFLTECILMFCFFLSFIIKMPLVPFHSWLSTLQLFTPSSGSIDLIGILLKTSVYGFLRFSIIFFPRAIHYFSEFFLFFGIISVIYGGFLACSQNNIKNFISYSSISHMGIVFMALHSENIIAYQGVILYIISYALSTSAFLIMASIIHNHIKSYNIFYMSDIFSNNPLLLFLFLFFSLVNLGLPCTGNFSGEFMMLWGIFYSSPWLGIALFFVFILSAIYCLTFLNKILYESTNYKETFLEVSILNISMLIILVVILIFLGIYPNFLIHFIYDITAYLYQPYIPFF